MKRKIRKFYQAVIAELTEHKNTFFVYLGLRLLVLGILILQIFHQNYENAFLCILTLILMITPSVIQATLKVEFSVSTGNHCPHFYFFGSENIR